MPTALNKVGKNARKNTFWTPPSISKLISVFHFLSRQTVQDSLWPALPLFKACKSTSSEKVPNSHVHCQNVLILPGWLKTGLTSSTAQTAVPNAVCCSKAKTNLHSTLEQSTTRWRQSWNWKEYQFPKRLIWTGAQLQWKILKLTRLDLASVLLCFQHLCQILSHQPGLQVHLLLEIHLEMWIRRWQAGVAQGWIMNCSARFDVQSITHFNIVFVMK